MIVGGPDEQKNAGVVVVCYVVFCEVEQDEEEWDQLASPQFGISVCIEEICSLVG